LLITTKTSASFAFGFQETRCLLCTSRTEVTNRKTKWGSCEWSWLETSGDPYKLKARIYLNHHFIIISGQQQLEVFVW